jgi:hypothetical protein
MDNCHQYDADAEPGISIPAPFRSYEIVRVD